MLDFGVGLSLPFNGGVKFEPPKVAKFLAKLFLACIKLSSMFTWFLILVLGRWGLGEDSLDF